MVNLLTMPKPPNLGSQHFPRLDHHTCRHLPFCCLYHPHCRQTAVPLPAHCTTDCADSQFLGWIAWVTTPAHTHCVPGGSPLETADLRFPIPYHHHLCALCLARAFLHTIPLFSLHCTPPPSPGGGRRNLGDDRPTMVSQLLTGGDGEFLTGRPHLPRLCCIPRYYLNNPQTCVPPLHTTTMPREPTTAFPGSRLEDRVIDSVYYLLPPLCAHPLIVPILNSPRSLPMTPIALHCCLLLCWSILLPVPFTVHFCLHHLHTPEPLSPTLSCTMLPAHCHFLLPLYVHMPSYRTTYLPQFVWV